MAPNLVLPAGTVYNVAYVSPGLGATNSILNVPCAAGGICRLGILHFQERFPTAFKPRTVTGPPPGIPLVTGFAPTADDGAFAAANAGFAQGASYPIPRFVWRPSVVAVPFIVVAPGETGFLHAGLEIPPGTNTAITFTSSDPSVADVTSFVTIPAGGTAPGYQSANINVGVGVGIGFMMGPLTISLSSRQARPLLSLSAPAPAGGLTITLRSADPRVASVPSAIPVPAGAMTAAVPITAVGTGTTLIHASLMPLVYDIGIIVTVIP